MSFREPTRVAGRAVRSGVITALLVAGVAGLGLLRHPSWSPSSATTSPPAGPPHRPHADHEPGTADGVVPDGVTVFEDRYPAVTRLDPALLTALRRAGRQAAGDGVELYVNSGWRSARYQEQLLDEAVSTHGSRAAAARWVATPATSPHVSGEAVDIGHAEADAWLSRYGAAYGLCRTYANEPWHFELRPDAVHDGCPRPYADPSHDPRMQR
jgi:hypothetical protein